MNKALAALTLVEVVDLLKKKKISHRELYADLNAAITQADKDFNIYLFVDEHAAEVSQRRQKRKLAGLPIAVKDNFLVKDFPTTASSNLLKEYHSHYQGQAVINLKDAGVVIHGKTNMDAWAHGSSTETSDFGTTLNPRNPKYLPGGSSGGSAAAVASNSALAALGTETAGSIRIPASWCGVVGMKPSYGRVSRRGVIAMASSTDSPGPITKTVEDAAILLQHMAGHDPLDSTSSTAKVPTYAKFLGKSIKNLKIGYLYHDLEGLEAIKPIFEKELETLERLGAHVEKAPALDPHYAISIYTVVQRAEVSSNLARFDGIRYGRDRSYFGEEAKRRIMLGTITLSKGYVEQSYTTAQRVRGLFIDDFNQLFKKYDLLVSLASPGYAPKLGASEGAAMFGELADMLEEPSSIAGLPGISVPCHRDPETNLYLGMNFVAPMLREDLVFQVAHAYEQASNWNEWKK